MREIISFQKPVLHPSLFSHFLTLKLMLLQYKLEAPQTTYSSKSKPQLREKRAVRRNVCVRLMSHLTFCFETAQARQRSNRSMCGGLYIPNKYNNLLPTENLVTNDKDTRRDDSHTILKWPRNHFSQFTVCQRS